MRFFPENGECSDTWESLIFQSGLKLSRRARDAKSPPSEVSLTSKCALQPFNVELLHPQHGLKGPLGF
jgi:hypothetical protein